MTEIAQIFESALHRNRENLHRRAALATLRGMPNTTTFKELLDSEAGEAILELSVAEFREALEAHLEGAGSLVSDARDARPQEGDDLEIFRKIVNSLDAPKGLTLSELSELIGLGPDALKERIAWMKKAGKVVTVGRGRGTRYRLIQA